MSVGVGCEGKSDAGLTEHVPEALDGSVGDGGDVDSEGRGGRRRAGLARETVEPQLHEPSVEFEHGLRPDAEIDANGGFVAH